MPPASPLLPLTTACTRRPSPSSRSSTSSRRPSRCCLTTSRTLTVPTSSPRSATMPPSGVSSLRPSYALDSSRRPSTRTSRPTTPVPSSPSLALSSRLATTRTWSATSRLPARRPARLSLSPSLCLPLPRPTVWPISRTSSPAPTLPPSRTLATDASTKRLVLIVSFHDGSSLADVRGCQAALQQHLQLCPSCVHSRLLGRVPKRRRCCPQGQQHPKLEGGLLLGMYVRTDPMHPRSATPVSRPRSTASRKSAVCTSLCTLTSSMS